MNLFKFVSNKISYLSNKISYFSNRISYLRTWFLSRSLPIKLIIVAVILFLGWFAFSRVTNSLSQKPQYQTAEVEKGTLVVSIAGSGQVSAANNALVNTQASGVVSEVYIQNGQIVNVGDKIAELESDLDGKQRATQALSSYQSAQNSLETAKANLFSLQSTMFTNWKTFMDLAQNSTYQNADSTPRTDQRQLTQFMSPNDDWLAAEAKYKNQQNVVNQAQTAVNSAWLSYQQASPVVYAPISGTVTGLSLQKGTVLVAQSNSSGNAAAQKIASIKTDAPAQIMVNLTEIDVPKVKVGNKTMVTLDALPGKTYTGKVVSIDTIGSISSGVTNYPAVIGLDTQVAEILPNMTVSAKIITNIIDNVILVPNSAVQTSDGQSIVRVIKDGKVSEVAVEVAGANDTQTGITSGLNEGDVVVTSIVTLTETTTTQRQGASSPFSSFGGGARGFSTNR